MARRLSPQLRAFLLGFRRAKAKMRAEVDAKIDELEATTDRMNAQMDATRNELRRLKAIDAAADIEREDVKWLH